LGSEQMIDPATREERVRRVYSYVSVKMVPVGSSEPGTAIGVESLTISIPM